LTYGSDKTILGNALDDESSQKSHQVGSAVVPEERLQSLSQKILLCANKTQPSVDFLIELSDILVSFSSCNALELWLREKGVCSCWEATAKPKRFYRLGNMSFDELENRIQKGLVCSNEPQQVKLVKDSGSFKSVASIPLVAGDEIIGLMLLKSDERGFYAEDVLQLYQYISQVVAISVAYHRVQLEQRERVKELACLYEIARTASSPLLSVDEILLEIVKHLPAAWQYPEITAAKIILDEKEHLAGKSGSPRHAQSSDIVVNGVQRGVVEVSYVEDKPELDEGPFLLEERRLIDTIAREVAVIIEQKRAEEDRTKLQEQLLHADRLATIGQLAAGVAHELNEPLGGILGFSQLASKHPEVPGQVKNDLSKIESASLHAREVVRKLMLFARQMPPSREEVDLNSLITEGLYFLESRCSKGGIDLEQVLSTDLPEVTVDPAQIHQVLVNLVVNAIQAMERGGRLTVETSCVDDFVSLAVSDTGCGIPKELLEKIFVPFYTTKDVGEGTGLGLPVVHGIVTSHGGDINVQSKVGEGTRFVVRLPVTPAEDTEQG
jgi:signal transduction histidine kinase